MPGERFVSLRHSVVLGIAPLGYSYSSLIGGECRPIWFCVEKVIYCLQVKFDLCVCVFPM